GLVRDYVDLAPDAAAEIAVNPHFQGAVDCLSMLYDDNAYFGHFARQCGPDTRLLSEITPQYAMLGRDGFDYVRRFFASQNMDLKILMVLRDPVQRLWSHLHFLKQTEPELDITRDWPDLIRRRAVIERSDYWQTIEALDAIFPDDAVLYLFYEDLFQGDALERLCAFVGLDHAPPDPQRRNETPDKSALPPDVQDRLTKVLNPQYRFCRDRFGAAIPKKWAA
ncbi:MAG: sulfotransferase domain-containing protein, partial [Pseudomonadota bacterium]